MNFERLVEVASSNKKGSVDLAKLFARSVVVSNDIEVKRLRAKTDLFEHRKKAYAAIKQSHEDQDKKDDVIGKVLGGLGLAGLAKGLRGAKTPPTAVVSPRPRAGRIPGIGRGAVGLNVLYGGIDFMQRKGAGQTNLQAGIGAGAGVAGGLAGAAAGGKLGALIGTAIAPGVGTLVGGGLGGLIGGGIGAVTAGNLADKATGVDAGEAEIDRRIQEEEKRTALLITKTPFSGALDTFDGVLDKLAAFKGGICACAGRIEPPGSAAISVPKDKLQEAYEKGLSEGRKQGGIAGGVAGFVAGVAVVGGVLYLTRGRGGAIVQRLGTVSDIVGTAQKQVPKVTPVVPKVKPAPPAPPTPTPPDAAARIQGRINEALRQTETRSFQIKQNLRKLQGEETAFKIAEITKKFKGKSNAEFSEWLKQNGDRILKGENGNEALKAIFNELRRRGMEVPPKLEKFILNKAGAGDTKPVVPAKGNLQSSVRKTSGSGGGETVLIASEPNTTIVPVAVGGGGGGGFVGGGGATPFEVATKYAKIMSQFTA